MQQYEPYLKSYARDLRKHQTDAEQLLWSKLRRKQLLGYQFYRQKPIGPYIVDFYCPTRQLVIELDGGQHYTDEGTADDQVRDAYLRKQSLTVMRFSDRDVLTNPEGVVAVIIEHLESKSPLAPL